VWAFGVLVAVGLDGWKSAAGWTIGSVVSVAAMWSLERFVRRTYVPGAMSAQRALVRFSVVKLVVVVVVLALAIRLGGKALEFYAALCAGLILTQSVVVLKVVGMIIVERANRQDVSGGNP